MLADIVLLRDMRAGRLRGRLVMVLLAAAAALDK
jgi:hypothetical protein